MCGLSRQVVSGDRFSCIEMLVLLPKMRGLSRQVVSHGSGLSRQVSLYHIQKFSGHHVSLHFSTFSTLKKFQL